MSTVNSVKRWWPLFLISALSLFLELAVIRWISGEIRLFAYLKNIQQFSFWNEGFLSI